jgi:uncharacterized protein (TIGR03437 family)
LGFRFRSDVNGFVTAVRFYKSAANTGTHIGNLWSDTGALLASATFTGESTSGWQQVNFSAPVAVAAGTTYVASYYTPAGHYSFTGNFFTPNGIDTPPLHALADGMAGSSGVFVYGGSSKFPSGTYQSANYWVDIVFTTVAPPPPAAVTVSKLICSPASIVAGSSAACTVTLSSAAPGGGSVVTLADNSAALTTPASVTVVAGATTGSFTATAGSVTADQPVTMTASLNGSNATSALTVVAAPVSTGLVAAYSFNEGTGTTVADASGNGNTGTITNATWSTAGKFGNALKFNGSNSWVTIKDSASLDLTKGMTLEGWINPTALGTAWRTLLLKEQPSGLVYSLYANTDTSQPSGHVYITTEYNTRGTAVAPLNAWTHLATTYDGATLRMYVNGVLASNKAVTGSIKASTGVLRIGGNSIWGEYFTGLIDEVRIYNRALAASEILSDMNSAVVKSLSKTVTPPSLTASGAPASNAAQALSLGCVPARVVAGGQALCELRLPAGSDASEIQVSSSSGSVRVPRRVQSRAGESRLKFQLSADAAAAGQMVTVTAASGNALAQETVLVAPAEAPLLQVAGKQFARFGKTLRFDISAGEGSGLPVQLMAADLPAGASFDAASGRFEWTPSESQQGSRIVSFAANAGGQSATARVTIDVDSGAPVIDQSAAFACSPGAIGSLQGKWLSGSAHGSTDLSGEALSLEGTGVKVNGEFAPVIEVSMSRVQFVCPALPAGTPLSVAVTTGAAETAALQSVMQAASPAIFSLNGSGDEQGVVSFARADELTTARDSRLAGRPAQAGDEILIWGTGFGSMDARSLRVEVGGAAAAVESVNAVPGQAGVYTIRARVAAAATPDAAASVRVLVYSPDGRQFESNTVTVALEAAAR